jgi:ribosomal protein S18 acetylase RimI-like enzyme
MALRTIQLPRDLEGIVDLLIHGFQYPENETWSLQTDQMENMLSAMKSIRRLWPLIWIAQRISSHWRDYVHGYLWEAGEKPVGVCVYSRQGEGWQIPYLAVLPEHRRRGIARQLMRATLEDIRLHGGKSVVLEVLAGNLPAYRLFEQSGFTKYSGYTEYFYDSTQVPAECPLPEGYQVQAYNLSDWRTLFELEQRITPAEVQQFEPVDPSRYRSQVSIRRVTNLIDKASGIRKERIIIRSTSDGRPVAHGLYGARRRPGGINPISMELDPRHGILAPFLVHHLIRRVQQLSPGRRIEFILPDWQGELIEVAERFEGMQRVPYHQLGLHL